MADTLGTVQSAWTVLGTTTNDTAASIDAYTIMDTLPTGTNPYDIDLPVSNTLSLIFYGEPTGTVNRVIEVQFWAVSAAPIGMEFKHFGIWLGKIQAEIGRTPSDDLEEDTLFFSDIRILDDRSLIPPAMRIVAADPKVGSTPGRGAAQLMFDTLGSGVILAQIICGEGVVKAGLGYRAF